jgi:hypothetical protein
VVKEQKKADKQIIKLLNRIKKEKKGACHQAPIRGCYILTYMKAIPCNLASVNQLLAADDGCVDDAGCWLPLEAAAAVAAADAAVPEEQLKPAATAAAAAAPPTDGEALAAEAALATADATAAEELPLAAAAAAADAARDEASSAAAALEAASDIGFTSSLETGVSGA